MNAAASRPFKCSAVISDVDGTLVTGRDKRLTERAAAAVAALRERGILFTIISSRPPEGLRKLIGPLGIAKPVGCFNGGTLVRPDLKIITEHILPAEVARRAVDLLDKRGCRLGFSAGVTGWCEKSTRLTLHTRSLRLDFRPKRWTVLGTRSIPPQKSSASPKICASGALRNGGARPPRRPRFGRPLAAILPRYNRPACQQRRRTHRDRGTPRSSSGRGRRDRRRRQRCRDVQAGRLSIAMGNASPDVQAEADLVTETNDDEGFANAIEAFILHRASAAAGVAP